MKDDMPSIRPQPIEADATGIASLQKRKRPRWLLLFGIPGAILVVGVAVMVVVYNYLLSPINSADTAASTIEIVSGTTPGEIGELLETEGVIRSSFAFSIYTRVGGTQNSLQAGTYSFSPSQSTPQVVDALIKGPAITEIEVTFVPGATLAQNKKVLEALGYESTAIDSAFAAHYDHPLFAGRPKGADIEGYLFGETHRFVKGTALEDILLRYFDDLYAVIEKNELSEAYALQKLNLYQGITLASIIQRESGGDDKAQIAQVFLKRLREGIVLGSDVTYQYIADKEGKPRDINYDSPYNTRRYLGLPPGPIASPGVNALQAVASPASGDYLYFLSGDDDVTYFARTLAEHEANIRNHCRQKCQII